MNNSIHQTITVLMMSMQIQILRGREKFDWDEAFQDSDNDVLVLLVTLQHEVSYDFSEQVRQAILKPSITEAHAQLQRVWSEYAPLPTG